MIKIKLNNLLYICVTIITIVLLTPLFTRNAVFLFFLVSIILFFNILFMLIKSKYILKNYKLIFFTVIWVIILLFYKIIGYSSTSIGNLFNYIKFYFILIVALFFLEKNNNIHKKRIIKIAWFVIFLNMISNIMLISKYKNANTLIMIKGNQFLKTNIGSVGFISLIFVFSLIMLLIFFTNNNIKYRIYSIISYILAFYLLIFKYRRATTSLLLVLFSSFFFIAYFFKKIKSKQKIIFGFFLGIGSILFTFFLIFVLAKYFKIGRLLIRIEWIKDLIFGNLDIKIIGQNSLSTRLYLIIGTVQTWLSSLKSFLFGVGDNLRSTNSIDEMFKLTGIGYHSDLVDILGTNGLLGGLFFYGILYRVYKIIIERYEKEDVNYVKIVFLGFLASILMNHNLGSELGIVMLFMLPYINILKLYI